MAKNRYINTAFWDDDYTSNLDPTEKLVFLYLLTNPATNMAGVYPLQLRRLAFDTGYDQEMIKKILLRFERDGKAFYEQGWLILKNFTKNQTYNPSTCIAVANLVQSLPDWLRLRLADKTDVIHVDYAQILAGSPQAVDRLSNNLNSNLNFNFNSNAAEAAKGDDKNHQGKGKGRWDAKLKKFVDADGRPMG